MPRLLPFVAAAAAAVLALSGIVHGQDESAVRVVGSIVLGWVDDGRGLDGWTGLPSAHRSIDRSIDAVVDAIPRQARLTHTASHMPHILHTYQYDVAPIAEEPGCFHYTSAAEPGLNLVVCETEVRHGLHMYIYGYIYVYTLDEGFMHGCVRGIQSIIRQDPTRARPDPRLITDPIPPSPPRLTHTPPNEPTKQDADPETVEYEGNNYSWTKGTVENRGTATLCGVGFASKVRTLCGVCRRPHRVGLGF